jgi:protein SCO1/2
MKSKIIFLSFLFLVIACSEKNESGSRVDRLPYYNEATFTPHWIPENDESLDTFHRISPFQLINQEGETISEKTFKDKIYVADFFFTSCSGICPKMTKNMNLIQTAFIEEEEVLLLSHSVTPDKDSVPILKSYAEEKGVISSKWHLVTGSQKEIYALGRQSYFVEEDLGLVKNEDDFLHTENFVLIDKDRHIRGIYSGLNKTSINQLIVDVRTLIAKK